MSAAQIVYVLGLAAVFAWRGPSLTAWVLLGNLIATLAACLAMDLGRIERDTATLSMMMIDLAAGALLLTAPGLPRVIALGYAVTVPLYALNILWGVQIGTTFAIVNLMGFLQIAVAGIAGGSGNDGGGSGRRDHVPVSVVVQGRDYSLGQMADAAGYDPISQNRR